MRDSSTAVVRKCIVPFFLEVRLFTFRYIFWAHQSGSVTPEKTRPHGTVFDVSLHSLCDRLFGRFYDDKNTNRQTNVSQVQPFQQTVNGEGPSNSAG